MNVNLADLAETLFEESGDALFLFDPDSEQLLDVNSTAQRLTGMSGPHLLSFRVDYLFRSEVQGGVQRLRQAYRKTGLFHSQEGFLLRHDTEGVWIPVNLTVARLHTAGGPLGLITARDVSVYRQAQVQLQQKDSELRQVLGSVSVYLWSMEIEGSCWRLRYISPAVERITGRPPAFYLADARRWWETLHPEDRPRLEATLERLLAERPPTSEQEYRILRPDGSVRWLRDSVSITQKEGHSGNGVLWLDGVVTDITERRQAEEALRLSEARHRLILDALSEIVYQVALGGDPLRGRVLFSGRQVEDTLGYRPEEFESEPGLWFQLVHPEDRERVADSTRQIVACKQMGVREYRLRHRRTGEYRWMEDRVVPLLDAGGEVIGLQGAARDVTEQRRLQAQLQQLQKMEAVGQMAGGVAHDFNNLLTAVLGNASLILNQVPAGDPVRKWAEAIEKAGLRAASLTAQMLGLSRQVILRPQPTNLNEIIDEVVALLRCGLDPHIRLEVRPAEQLRLVLADAGQMNQVLMNLCLNARDAMLQGGYLTVETANVTVTPEHARLHLEARAGDCIRLRVHDTGVGIAPEVLPRIFDPFFTTKGPDKGTGLGLAMVYGIVKQHQGWIEVASTVGTGTVFDIYLPTLPFGVAGDGTDREVAGPPAPVTVGQTDRPGQVRETVLVVDDEPVLCSLARTILEESGYRVLLAEDGLRALELYRRECGRIDLVLLDLVMPRLSGSDTFRRLVQVDPGVRVLFASGYSAEYLGDLRDERIRGFVAKPYRPEELVQGVRAALERSVPRPASEGSGEKLSHTVKDCSPVI
jgi:PAS domain S-box-containing protein